VAACFQRASNGGILPPLSAPQPGRLNPAHQFAECEVDFAGGEPENAP